MRYLDPVHVSTDNETSVTLFTMFEYGQSKDSESLERIIGYMVLFQKVIRDSVQSASLYFMPSVRGYAAACDYVISLRQQIWGDSAP